MRPVYAPSERFHLAAALTEAFAQGHWTVAGLAERGAAVLEPRPDWLEPLAFAAAAAGRTRPLSDRNRLRQFIEDWLEERPSTGRGEGPSPTGRGEESPGGGEEPPPAISAAMLAQLQSLHRTGRRRPRPERGPVIARGWPLAEIASVAALAEHLELDLGQLAWLADVRGLERTAEHERLRNYRYRWVARRSGLPRLIEAPKLRLKEIQRWILREILSGAPAHDAAHGFTRGRSAITHATLHCGQAAVLALDLRDFFASVPAGRVFGIFRTLGYTAPVAHVLTGLCTNVAARIAWQACPAGGEASGARFGLGRALATPHLPQGAPTSPALANLAAFGLDRRLTGLAGGFGLCYSRYADDLTLSGPALGGRRAAAISEYAARIAREEGFALQPRKSRLRTAARRQVVTGVVVNAHPNIARPEYDRLRAMLHRLALDGPEAAVGARAGDAAGGVAGAGDAAGGVAGAGDASGGMAGAGEQAHLRARLQGRVAWVESLNPTRGAKLRRLYDAIDWGTNA